MMYSVGTKVKIKEPSDKTCWVDGMNKYIGKVGRIARATPKNGGVEYLVKQGNKWMMSELGIPYTFIDEMLKEV